MKVSVVIPVYNEEKYIGACLKSLQNQREKPDEIIVVDNNCTDNTVTIAKQYPVRIVKEKKQGMSHARNAGFDAARYDIIARCDADAIAPPRWIEKIKSIFETKKIDGLSGVFYFYDIPFKNVPFLTLYIDLMRVVLKHRIFIGAAGFAIKKSMWKKVKDKTCVDDNEVHEDIDLSIHIAKENGIIYYDQLLTLGTSARRIKNNPGSFFLEYPTRIVKMLRMHG